MSHKCLRCGKIFEDNDSRILNGCDCGSVYFMYFKSMEDLERIEKMEMDLKKKKINLEKELGEKIKKTPIETVRSPKEGVYEINIEALMSKKPLIILEKNSVYFIHLPSVFEKLKS